MGVTIETSPILTPRNVKASPARNSVPTVAGCQSIAAGCMVPPVSVRAEKPIAVTQVTTIRVVHVEVSRAWARLSSSRPKTVRMLDANGSNRWMADTPCGQRERGRPGQARTSWTTWPWTSVNRLASPLW